MSEKRDGSYTALSLKREANVESLIKLFRVRARL